MPTDTFARASLRPIARRTAVSLVVALVAASPALAQFTPRFETLAPLSVNIGPDQGKHSFVLADVNNDRRPDLITIEEGEDRVDVYINMGNGTFDLLTTPVPALIAAITARRPVSVCQSKSRVSFGIESSAVGCSANMSAQRAGRRPFCLTFSSKGPKCSA